MRTCEEEQHNKNKIRKKQKSKETLVRVRKFVWFLIWITGKFIVQPAVAQKVQEVALIEKQEQK